METKNNKHYILYSVLLIFFLISIISIPVYAKEKITGSYYSADTHLSLEIKKENDSYRVSFTDISKPDWEVYDLCKLKNNELILFSEKDEESQIKLNFSNGSINVKAGPHFEAKAYREFSGIYFQFPNKIESKDNKLKSMAGLYNMLDMNLIITPISNNTAFVTLINKNRGQTYISQKTALLINGDQLILADKDLLKQNSYSIIKINYINKNKVNVDVSEYYQTIHNATIAGEYKKLDNSFSYFENNLIDNLIGNYSLNHNIFLDIKKDVKCNDNQYKIAATIGDDIVLGKTTRYYTKIKKIANVIVGYWEHGIDSFIINGDSSISFSTNSNGNVFSGTYFSSEK